MASPSIVYECQLIGVKIFDQVVDVSLDCGGAFDISDMSGVKPVRQARQSPKTCAGSTVPKFPLGALELADRMTTKVDAGCTGAKAACRLQGVFKPHGDVKPVEDQSGLWQDVTLQLPQSRVAIAEHRRRSSKTDARAHNRVGKFAHGIAVAGKREPMLRSIEIEHLARDHFKIPLGSTMPTAQIAAIEADHHGGSHRVNVGVCCSLGTQPRDTLADAAGSIAHRAAGVTTELLCYKIRATANGDPSLISQSRRKTAANSSPQISLS